MTTRRMHSQATSRDGINFVRTLVEQQNCTFQEIDLHNDLGNDAYVEFVVDQSATGCCVALQIKSGSSYRTTSGRYFFQADQDHFEYWSTHTLPVIAVIYDPLAGTAAWCDITQQLRANPASINAGPYTIYADLELSRSSFESLRDHCLEYRNSHSLEVNLGRALQSFADRNNFERCVDGFQALFSFHRQSYTMWYYVVSALSNYRDYRILPYLIARLSYIPGHPDIFWMKKDEIDAGVRRAVAAFMHERLDYRDAVTLLSVIDEDGIARGTIGQCVHALVHMMRAPEATMESIAVDQSVSLGMRHNATILAAEVCQRTSKSSTLAALSRIRESDIDGELGDAIDWLESELSDHGYISLF